MSNPDANTLPGAGGPSFPVSTRRVLEKLTEGIVPDLSDLDMVSQGVVTAVNGPAASPPNVLTATLQAGTGGVTMHALSHYKPVVGDVIWAINLSGAWIALGPVNVTDFGWNVPTLLHGWTNIGAGFTAAGYRREGNRVYLSGFVVAGVLGAPPGGTIFVLPVGYRPVNQTGIIADTFNPPGFSDVRIDNAGNVWVQAGGAAGAWTCLDGVSFWLN